MASDVMKQQVVLAIDTAGPYLGLALQTAKGVFSRHWLGDSGQQEILTVLLQDLLQEAMVDKAAIDLIAVLRGPGTFTGLRVGMAAAKALSVAWSKPLVSLSTLAVYAKSLAECDYGAVVLDARKGRYYAQLFKGGQAISDELDVEAQQLVDLMLKYGNQWQLCGYGAQSFVHIQAKERLNVSFIAPLVEDGAVLLASCAWLHYSQYGEDSAQQGPNYLRLSEAELSLAVKL